MEKETLKAIAEIDAKVAAAEEGVVTLKQQRGDLYRTLRERILHGGTTGDDIRDLVIQATGSDNAELESRYRKLNERLKGQDRKSTRLNSSHMSISYAVFCLKKKTGKLFPNPTYQQTTMKHPPSCHQLTP